MNRCPSCGSPHGFRLSLIRTGRRFLGFYWAAISGDLMECSGCHTIYRSTNEGVLAYKKFQPEAEQAMPHRDGDFPGDKKGSTAKPKTGPNKWLPKVRTLP